VSESKTQATARVLLTLEIPLEQPWSGEDTIDRVLSSGRREAREIVTRMLRKRPSNSVPIPEFPRGTRIVGDIEVQCVIAESKS